ncbi:MAG: hypothetical protein EBY37_04905 [Flavobacteriia bacterium]|nr:hypothetical protein [Flavobacteriia bacterium]
MTLMGILLLIKRIDRYFNLPPFIFLTTPLVLFLVPQNAIQIKGLVLSIFLALAFQEFVLMEQRSQILKPLLNSALYFTLIAFIEPQLSPLFLIIMGTLILKKQVNLKAFIAVITPVLTLYFLFTTLHFFWDFEKFQFWKSAQIESRSFTSVEGLIFSVFGLFVAAVYFFSKASQSTLSSSLKNLFHLVILGLGLFISLTLKEQDLSFYEIILFSIIYLSALSLNNLSNLKVNLVLLLFILLKIMGLFFTIGAYTSS